MVLREPVEVARDVMARLGRVEVTGRPGPGEYRLAVKRDRQGAVRVATVSGPGLEMRFPAELLRRYSERCQRMAAVSA